MIRSFVSIEYWVLQDIAKSGFLQEIEESKHHDTGTHHGDSPRRRECRL